MHYHRLKIKLIELGLAPAEAAELLAQLRDDELDHMLEHLREAQQPEIGIAAIVHRARLRLAAGDAARICAAEREAETMFRTIKRLPELTGGPHIRPPAADQPYQPRRYKHP